MRVTEKGQVTIPQNVRRHLGIVPGSEVEFELKDGQAWLRPVVSSGSERASEARQLVEHLRRHKGTLNLRGLSPGEFYRMLRD